MKVFISSVRSGLEEERDALPGLLLALGHEPLRFEDFTSRPTPSREACLRGVEHADVDVLLAGERYGDPLDDTGIAPTEEEYKVAQRRGIPRLLFRKQNVTFEPKQEQFVNEVEKYATGLFRKSYSSTADLQTKVVEALKELPTGKLEWSPLDTPVTVSWQEDWQNPNGYGDRRVPGNTIELHTIPVPAQSISRRRLSNLDTSIASRIRASDIIPSSTALETGSNEKSAWVSVPNTGSRNSDVDNGGFAGCRISSEGQLSAWERLPSDNMGIILDKADIIVRIASLLRTLGNLDTQYDGSYAIALGLNLDTMAVEGNISQLGHRHSVSSSLFNDSKVRVPADELVPADAIVTAADEIGETLAQLLLDEFRRLRR